MSAQKVVITLDKVVKEFPDPADKGKTKAALHEITAKVRTGVITGLVGPDGAGKTTMIRLMGGLLEATKGTVRVLDMDPIKDSSGLRQAIGYMPQKFGLYEDLSVQENLNLYADLRGVLGKEREESFGRLLEFTSLQRFTDRRAGRLSGGMKQKLGLACALLGQPKVLLLDEPGVGVDPISRRELWKMVEDLAKSGLAVLWSTAYLDEAELCDEVLLLNEGKLLFDGSPKELTGRVKERCMHIRNIEGNRRQLLTRALNRPEVMDGVIQGRNVRILLKEGAKKPDLAELEAGPKAELASVTPHFEDGFIDILGGGPGGHSVLAEQLEALPLDGAVVIEAEHLTKKFGDFTATDDVTFKVTRGEIFGLLGPNGAGKSTTFKMMCGLLTPTSGTAKVTGYDLKRSASKARQQLGYMAQKFSLYSTLSVRQNLNFFSGVYGLYGAKQKKTVEEMIDVFGLKPFLEAAPDTLPLGYRQRLALACAVMHEPAILFLDEPTSGVDPVTRREFWTHINGIVEKGVTVMVTTHFMDEAEYCDRIGLVSQGQLIATGTPDDLKEMAATKENEDPTMEDAFISLVQQHAEKTKGAAKAKE
ncbi:MAG: ATP-binding cassette domain-containing protein [Candidatus Methylacidiphilales bacterium]|nr:ATP-binding cassette domain-containing protein [Candidatus Methylacidiphilales bacterium]